MEYDVNYSDSGLSGWTNTGEMDMSPEFWADVPKPLFWRVIILPMKPKEVSKGGIVLARANQEAQEILNFMGKVVALGPQAGVHERLGGDGKNPSNDFPKIGDFVIFGRYAGQRLMYKGTKLLLLNDDELLGVAPNPEALNVSV